MKAIWMVIAFFTVVSAHAATLELPTIDQGRFSLRQATGENSRGNYFTGAVEGWEWRSYFVFDLSTLEENVTDAVLRLPLLGDAWSHDKSNQTLTFYDVSTDPTGLNQLGMQPNAFADLGSGLQYGSVTFSTATPPDQLSITLNQRAVAELNATRGGLFSIGAAMSSVVDFRRQEAGAFGNTTSATRGSLILTTAPGQSEPALLGDYNGNGIVEQADLDLVLLNWGGLASPLPAGWIDGLPTGTIDQEELDAVLLDWGNSFSSSPATAGVPEPSTWVVGAIILLLRCMARRPRLRGAMASPAATCSSRRN